jgi:Tol biopolymer transport system component
VLASTAAAGSAARPAARIAFLRGDRLFFMNPDGSGQRSAGTRASGFPAWSPDGRRIAFAVRGPQARIYVADANGRNRRPVTAAGFHDCFSFAWSPAGRQIAYSRNVGCEGELDVFVVRNDGRLRRRLTAGMFVQQFGPVWSPDGRTLTYWSHDVRASGTRLFLIRAEGRDRRVLRGVDGRGTTGLPMRPQQAWSRDRRRLFYIGSDDGLHLVHMSSAVRRTLTPRGTVVVAFTLSPDRRRIALAAAPSHNRAVEIYVMSADGTGFRRVTDAPPGQTSSDPQWSPDGRRLVFTRRISANAPSDIYAVNVDGSGETNLTRNPADDVAPAWAPNR